MTIAYLLLTVAIAQPPNDDAAQAELKRLEGKWLVESISFLGKPEPAEKLKGETLTIKAGKYEATTCVSLMGFSKSGTILVDPKQKPATLTRRVDVDIPGAGWAELYNGIYKLEADKLTVCFGVGIDGAERPADFEATDKVTVMIFRRARPDRK